MKKIVLKKYSATITTEEKKFELSIEANYNIEKIANELFEEYNYKKCVIVDIEDNKKYCAKPEILSNKLSVSLIVDSLSEQILNKTNHYLAKIKTNKEEFSLCFISNKSLEDIKNKLFEMYNYEKCTIESVENNSEYKIFMILV